MIVEIIQKKCRQRNITLAALERATGIGNGVIARWEKGRARIDLVKKVADYFGCSVDELISGENNNEI